MAEHGSDHNSPHSDENSDLRSSNHNSQDSLFKDPHHGNARDAESSSEDDPQAADDHSRYVKAPFGTAELPIFVDQALIRLMARQNRLDFNDLGRFLGSAGLQIGRAVFEPQSRLGPDPLPESRDSHQGGSSAAALNQYCEKTPARPRYYGQQRILPTLPGELPMRRVAALSKEKETKAASDTRRPSKPDIGSPDRNDSDSDDSDSDDSPPDEQPQPRKQQKTKGKCNIPGFVRDPGHQSKTTIFKDYSANKLPAACGRIVAPNTKGIEYPTLKNEFGQTIYGTNGDELWNIHPDFPMQISSNRADAWKHGVLSALFPAVPMGQFRNRTFTNKSDSAFSNQQMKFRKENYMFSNAESVQTDVPKRELDLIWNLSNDQLERNTGWTLSSDKTMMRQPLRSTEEGPWHDVPWPAANFLSTEQGKRLKKVVDWKTELIRKATREGRSTSRQSIIKALGLTPRGIKGNHGQNADGMTGTQIFYGIEQANAPTQQSVLQQPAAPHPQGTSGPQPSTKPSRGAPTDSEEQGPESRRQHKRPRRR